MIAKRLATKPNFSGYSFVDEMISDGVQNCIEYFDRFDPEKYPNPNPFSYFTQIIFYAFLRRIGEEHKYLYTKYKNIQKANVFDETSAKQSSDMGGYNDEINCTDNMNEFVRNFERKKLEKKNKMAAAKAKKLENENKRTDKSTTKI